MPVYYAIIADSLFCNNCIFHLMLRTGVTPLAELSVAYSLSRLKNPSMPDNKSTLNITALLKYIAEQYPPPIIQ
ncbi:MAG: hypothetical protein JRJ37_06985 [Deltaproteobacteria bacterium]|nr:hypothetical protein [Deltaproteobacteria bacterium]